MVTMVAINGHDIGVVELEDGTWCLFDFGCAWDDAGKTIDVYADESLALTRLRMLREEAS